ncbi:DUF952 domain-containing protein [Maritalea mediterranea]|uniref:DUF952 domain-containing protein n=1 Tax=Maritalea mediterranea TaxID=2909667 RepID=A0ABS9E466_9HYPH|nr:DUF952 domain-containing protein [Maritalea mediterranea]MCF4097646.1 DUF952 domain-containing protein [Maritalea mediterranea]
MIIYKVCPKADYEAAKDEGFYRGMPVDIEDGFMHFSTAAQLPETLEKHFAGQSDLVLLYVDAEWVENHLKWEPSRGDDLFPHLYAELNLAHVLRTHDLKVDENGRFILPDDIR